jgi:integrase
LILHTTGYIDCPNTISSRVGAAFLFAIETAMRAGEIVDITPDRVNMEKRTVELPLTKNGSSRKVPLSTKALEIVQKVGCDFGVTSRQLDSNFRKARDMCGIDNLHFHDSRHQAITNLAKKIEVLDLARITGIKDLKILLVYYNETAESIAKKLD